MFLEVLTRHMVSRHKELRINQASLAILKDADFAQTILVDDVGRGIGWTHMRFREHGPLLNGHYIWILDDDDMCIRPSLIDDLKGIVAKHNPDMIITKMDHGEPLGVLPSGVFWKRRPFEGWIGVSSCFVRRAVWRIHAAAWGDRYAGDFDFIFSVWAGGHKVHWFDAICSSVQRAQQSA